MLKLSFTYSYLIFKFGLQITLLVRLNCPSQKETELVGLIIIICTVLELRIIIVSYVPRSVPFLLKIHRFTSVYI